MSTLKQKKASKLVEIGRTLGEVMVEAGYSPNTAKAPTKLTNSKGWIELMDKYLPDDEVLAEHQKGLHATKPIGALVIIKKDGEREVIYKDNEGVIEVDDTPTRLKAVELAYKVKGKMKEVSVNQQFNFGKVLQDERKEFAI